VKRHNFFLPEELVASMKAHCELVGMPMSELVRRALQAYLDEIAAKDAS
jgi:Arc/MetJ-type ribon-helix-helix transcriptional regulator